MRSLLKTLCLLCLFYASALSAQDISGVWIGTYSANLGPPGCSGIGPRAFTGEAIASFEQSGNSFQGFAVLLGYKEVIPTGDSTCEIFDVAIGVLLTGTVNGSNISGTAMSAEGLEEPFSATLQSGNVISGSISTGEGPVTFELTRFDQPTFDFSGTWNGDYHFTDSSGNCSTTSSGNVSADFIQSDGVISGLVTLTDVVLEESGCIVTQKGTATLDFSGTAIGNAFQGTLSNGGEFLANLDGFFDGVTLLGEISAPDVTGSFSMERSSGSPVIESFTATPELIRAGESTSLSWVADGASSVTITPGPGMLPPRGSIMVSPTATTAYTLTASRAGGSSTANIIVEVITVPDVQVTLFPSGLIEPVGSGGATTSFTLYNAGGAATAVTLGQTGSFFTQTPSSFTLAPGATQVVTITTAAQPSGTYAGASIPSGQGVPAGLSIPVTLLVIDPPSAPAVAAPATNRVDVSAPPGGAPSGSASFTNTGAGKVSAIVSADVPWLIPSSQVVSIEPGANAAVGFTIDRSRRPDAGSTLGSVSGRLLLTYLSGPASKPVANNGAGVSLAVVTVVDTAAPPVSPGSPPPIGPGEVAFFIPGVGHAQGSVGLFLSDVFLLNDSEADLTDLKMYYTAAGSSSSQVASLSVLPPNQPLPLADIVKSTFQKEGEIGTLQVRTKNLSKVSLAANVFNSSNAQGTYGTVIPVFRSDRGAAPGTSLHITGLRANESSHTNFYLQEVAGSPASVDIEFLDAAGNVIGSRNESLAPFGLVTRNNVVPLGTVSAILTNKNESGGRVVAYATPVDRLSGDTWTVVDWRRQLDYSPAEPIMIPVAGSVRGANDSFFRTDVALMNTAESQATGTIRYHAQTGGVTERSVNLGPRQTQIIEDVVGTLFGISGGTVGYIVYSPEQGATAITSRTYTTVSGASATFGTGVPTVAVSSSLEVGELKRIGGLDDAALATIVARRPATFRTNLGLVEASGQPATVRLTMRYSFVTGKTEIRGTASREFALGPGQFLQVNNISRQILGAERDATLGDARNLQLDFEVTAGGSVIVFTSSIDNGTNDSTLRME